MPSELFVRVVHQNEGKLSNTRRQSHFSWMTDAEVSEAEAVVRRAFLKSAFPDGHYLDYPSLNG